MNRWRTLAIVLILLIVIELAIAWKNWDTIKLAYNNRKTIADAGAIAGGVAALGPAISDIKSLFQ